MYQMAKDGIGKLIIGQLIMIIAIVVTSFTFMIDVSENMGLFLVSVMDLVAMLAVLFAFVFMLMGYFSARKDEKAFWLPFTLCVVGILAQIVYVIFLFAFGATQATVMEIASDFVEIMIVLSACSAFVKLLRMLHGNSKVTASAGRTAKIFMILMILASGMDVIAIYAIKQNLALTVMFAFAYLVLAAVAYILFLLFLGKARKILE